MISPLILLLAAADPLAITDAERARLEQGEVLVGTVQHQGRSMNSARAVIDAPPEKVWPLVWNCARFAETMPSIAKSEMVSHEGNTAVCRVVADLPFPMADLTSVSRAVVTVEPGVRWHREWKMIEGDYEVNQGSFTLLPWGTGKTLAIYRIDARPKIPLPEWVLAKAQSDRLPEMMGRLRKHAAKP